jgi:hypothetical protein
VLPASDVLTLACRLNPVRSSSPTVDAETGRPCRSAPGHRAILPSELLPVGGTSPEPSLSCGLELGPRVGPFPACEIDV